MSNHLPSIGVVVNCTNSLSRGYIAYLAAIDSWSQIADQLVIVDGGTTDQSYDILKDWTNGANFEVYRSKESLWGTNGRWHAGQWTVNTNIGLSKLETDWAFIICADYVLKLETISSIREILSENSDAYALKYRRNKLDNSGKEYITPLRGIALNLKKIRVEKKRVGWGVATKFMRFSDYPILLQEHSRFIDPINSLVKSIYRGDWLTIDKELDLTCSVYGHFFFNVEQVISKISEFNIVYQVRLSKRAPKTRALIMKEFGLGSGCHILPKDIELKKPHPSAIKKVIDHFYRSNMLGHSGGFAKRQPFLARNTIRLYQAMRSGVFLLKPFPTVYEMHQWCPIDEAPSHSLEVKNLYQIQDRYLPRDFRINWSPGENNDK